MPIVFIPPQLRSLCGEQKSVQVDGHTVRELITALENRFPGIEQRLCKDGELKPALSVTIDNDVSSLGIAQTVQVDSEVHFLPAIGGG